MNNTESFNMTESQLQALVGWLIQDKDFFLAAHEKIKPNYFYDPILSEIFIEIKKFYNNYNKLPTIEELDGVFFKKYEQLSKYKERKEKLLLCIEMTQKISLQFLIDNITTFLKQAIAMNALKEMVNFWNLKKFNEVITLIHVTSDELKSIHFTYNKESEQKKEIDHIALKFIKIIQFIKDHPEKLTKEDNDLIDQFLAEYYTNNTWNTSLVPQIAALYQKVKNE